MALPQSQPSAPSGDLSRGRADQTHATKQRTLHTKDELVLMDKHNLKLVNHFVRGHSFIQRSLNGHTTSERRIFERNVYDYARSLGLQRRDAKIEVLKGRGFCGELDYNSDVSVLGDEVDDSMEILAVLAARPGPPQTTPRGIRSTKFEGKLTKKNIESGKASRQSNAIYGSPTQVLDFNAGPSGVKLEATTEFQTHFERFKRAKKRKSVKLEPENDTSCFGNPQEHSSRKKAKRSKDVSFATHQAIPTSQAQHDVQEGNGVNSRPQLATIVDGKADKKKRGKSDRHGRLEVGSPSKDVGPSSTVQQGSNPPRSDVFDGISIEETISTAKLPGKQNVHASIRSTDTELAAQNGTGNLVGDGGGVVIDERATENTHAQLISNRKSAKREHRRKRKEPKAIENELEAQEPEVGRRLLTKAHEAISGPANDTRTEGSHTATLPVPEHTSYSSYSAPEAQMVNQEMQIGRPQTLAAEPDLADHANIGAEVKSAYFTPISKKTRKLRATPVTITKGIVSDGSKAKTSAQLKQEVKEKQAKFRAEVAAGRRLSNESIATTSLQGQNTNKASSEANNIPKTSPRPDIDAVGNTNSLANKTVQALVSTQKKPKRNTKNKKMDFREGNEASQVAHLEKISIEEQPTEQVIETFTPNTVAEDDNGQYLKWQVGVERILPPENDDGMLHQVADLDGIERTDLDPIIPESLSDRSGRIRINQNAVTSKRWTGLDTSDVHQEDADMHSGYPLLTNNEDRQNSTKGLIDLETLNGEPMEGKSNPRQRNSRAKIVEGTTHSEVLPPVMKSRKVKQEPKDFQFPMIHTANASAYGNAVGETLIKDECLQSKMDLSYIMANDTGYESRLHAVSHGTQQSSPLSSLSSSPCPPSWLLQDGPSIDWHTRRVEPVLTSVAEASGQLGVCDRSAVTSVAPHSLSGYSMADQALKLRSPCFAVPPILRSNHTPPPRLSALLVPPILRSTHTPPQTPRQVRRKSTARASTFFPKAPKAPKPSCIPFPPLNASTFGLVQERLCHDPFRLLLAVMFLNRTKGTVALPVCFELFSRYPTPAALYLADLGELTNLLHGLGFHNQRAARMIKLAQTWLVNPPRKGQRYRKLHYPRKEDGKDIRKGTDPISDEDPRVAWEIAHLPGAGAYAIDSWRIFCRDELRGLPVGIPQQITPQNYEEELQKEWARVLPQDKELRAYLKWRWLRIGWKWDPTTGLRTRTDQEYFDQMRDGGLSIEEGDEHRMEGVHSAFARIKIELAEDTFYPQTSPTVWRDGAIAGPPVIREMPNDAGSARSKKNMVSSGLENEEVMSSFRQMPGDSSQARPVPELDFLEKKYSRSPILGSPIVHEDTDSETSRAIQAALSWLHADDWDENSAQNENNPTARRPTTEEASVVKKNANGGEYPWLLAHSTNLH